MLDRVRFFLQHSINDLRVNRQRTLFALLCIAAGVAAIVSLQTLAVMISGTLTGNLQENNRGDIQLMPLPDAFGESSEALQRGVEDGLLTEMTTSFMGQQFEQYFLSEDGQDELRAWFEANYPGQVDVTFHQLLADPMSLFVGGGRGSSVTNPQTGTAANQLMPLVIDVDVYPFYSEVRTQQGQTLAEAITQTTDIILSENVAADLDVSVGDTVLISRADEPFTVVGVVDTSAEVKDPGVDIFLALFGYYYLDQSAMSLFEDVETMYSTLYVRLDNAEPEQINAINASFREQFPYLETTTTEDLRLNYDSLSDAIDQLVTVMGLVALLIGSIGIINTMQVIVRRRTVEVAVLKTIGLQANEVTILFLVEAFIMGVVGSVLGVLLGWVAVFGIRGAAETVLATSLDFRFALEPVVNGLLVGTVITTVFGFLPTLSAGQVRPAVVLRPTDDIVPRAGRWRVLLALVVTMALLIVIAQTILNNITLAVAVIVGASFAVALLYGVLNLMVWLVGRFFPSLGIVDLKISLRQMLAGRSRAAITLLALVIGVFSLSLITLFAQSISNLLEYAFDEAAGGNTIVMVQDESQLDDVLTILDANEAITEYRTLRSFTTQLESLEEGGTVLSLDEIDARMADAPSGGMMALLGSGSEAGDFRSVETLSMMLGSIDAVEIENVADHDMRRGRALTPADEGQPVMVVQENDLFTAAGVDVGDRLTFTLNESDETITLEVVGIQASSLVNSGFENASYAPVSAFEGRAPDTINVITRADSEALADLRRDMAAVPGTFIFETTFLVDLVTGLIDTFTAFPSMVAALGLIVGGVVIANSVALTTMERRREIAVMKAIGLHRERVLGMILLENGVLGLIGGLIGVGIGLVWLSILTTMLALTSAVIPFGTAFLLMLLCVAVALIAAMTTAWTASGEKPLNVLRYE